MTEGAGKGAITLDDIAKGVTYNPTPYQKGDKFEVVTPDVTSQQRFYTINNYTHKYLEKEKRSPFVEYRQKIVPTEGIDYKTILQRKQEREQAQLHPQAPPAAPDQPKVSVNVDIYHPATSTLVTNPTAKPNPISRPSPGIAESQRSQTAKSHKRISLKADIYHPKELYSPQGVEEDAAFKQANPFGATKYHDMLSTLNMDRTASIADVIKKSQEVAQTLRTTLKQQSNKAFLQSRKLPEVPRTRGEPRVMPTIYVHNVAKRAENTAHNKVTNGGYSRPRYGGFYMH
jgi:hypothetical protein